MKTKENTAQAAVQQAIQSATTKTNTPLLKAFALSVALVSLSLCVKAQNPKIKCYFNHPVNTNVSSGTNATYLNLVSADTIAAYINRAKYTVDIAQYDYTASSSSYVKRIADAVNNANLRGVVIRWIYNGSSSNTGLSLITWNATAHKLASLVQSGYIMHNKFIAIDANSSNASDAILWTGSYDWSDQQNSSDYNNMVIVQDQALTQAYDAQFNQMWGGSGPAPGASPKFSTSKTVSAVSSFTVNGTAIEVYFSPKDNAQTQLINMINSANYEFQFGIYTFTQSSISGPISTKYNSGGFNTSACLGIMDQYSNTYTPWSTLSASSSMGSRVKMYSGSYIYHNKMMVVDALHPASDPQVGTGSYNWTTAGNTSNDENFIVIHDATIANEYYQSLCADFASVGGAACTALTTGIDNYDLGQQQMAVYPNPAIDLVNISVKNAGETLSVKIMDQLGKTVFEKEAYQSNDLQLNLSELNKGVYLVLVTSGNNHYTQKLIK